jgi:hypothetical protein
MQQDNFNKMVGVLAAGVSIACISSFVTSKILNNEPCEVYYEEYIYEAVLEEETQEETELSEEQKIAKIQEIIGADPDGVWGNESEEKLREYLGIEVQAQNTRQTQNVVNGCRSLQDIRNDIDYVDQAQRHGTISISTWRSRKRALQDEYTRCDPRLR